MSSANVNLTPPPGTDGLLTLCITKMCIVKCWVSFIMCTYDKRF